MMLCSLLFLIYCLVVYEIMMLQSQRKRPKALAIIWPVKLVSKACKYLARVVEKY